MATWVVFLLRCVLPDDVSCAGRQINIRYLAYSRLSLQVYIWERMTIRMLPPQFWSNLEA